MATPEQSLVDRLMLSLDRAVKTLSPGTARAQRQNPGAGSLDQTDDPQLRQHVAGLMRVNHTGEVCAQALYQGQALTARLAHNKQAMAQAADEEIDHLAWCEDRLRELDSNPSVLNPAFYALSFSLGAAAGIIGDRLSLGFVAATEQQVCKHLQCHLEQIPSSDQKSRKILQKMLEDEGEHAEKALEAGGISFTGPVKQTMSLMSQVMTKTTYYL
jgi:ubiquinone biosynthesis monooxygenase Coq7